MEIHFDIVRIGKPRQSIILENDLKQKSKLLKQNIKEFLKGFSGEKEYTVIVIPGKGNRITFTLQDIQDRNIRNELEQAFSHNIYKGEYSKLIENIKNRSSQFL